MDMVTNCKDCKNKCCKAGPGPYVEVYPEVWFTSRGSEKYNTVCINFNLATEECLAWNSEELPRICKTYICSNKIYSKEELDKIDGMYK